jgi:hypothetical protein
MRRHYALLKLDGNKGNGEAEAEEDHHLEA